MNESERCGATTRKGERCRLPATEPGGGCHRHPPVCRYRCNDCDLYVGVFENEDIDRFLSEHYGHDALMLERGYPPRAMDWACVTR